MIVETFPFEPDEHFGSVRAQEYLLTDAVASGDAGYIADAVGIVARNRGLDEVASRTGVDAGTLGAALRPGGTPPLELVLKVLDALGYELVVKARETAIAA